MTILFILFIYLISMALTCFINAANSTRCSVDVQDFFLLTCMPYVLFNLKKIRDYPELKPTSTLDKFLNNLNEFKNEKKVETFQLTVEELKDLGHSATGNIKDFVMNDEGFVDDWLRNKMKK